MIYDACIIGGGLAGLALSIDLAGRGFSVVVIEKGNYPRHKVCGEYVSMESYDYLLKICPSLKTVNFPFVNKFQLSSTGKKVFNTPLSLGGFGISRYLLEQLLYEKAKQVGVTFHLGTKARRVFQDTHLKRYSVSIASQELFSRLVFTSTGRRADERRKGASYVGVKYHVRLERDESLIEIHNFPGGYAGISNVEEGKACFCYIINAQCIKGSNKSIGEAEKKYLYRNARLKEIVRSSEFLFKEPVTVSGINFNIRETVADGSLILGDAAGSIAPITGNGMSMGLRAACMLSKFASEYFTGIISEAELRKKYSNYWKDEFESRIKLSRYFQKLSEKPLLSNVAIRVFSACRPLARAAISLTHGQPFL
ncbi:MAG: NAD(P)/FAD-dependent oxidoreductase [Bacteroidetes bacterium]|nr:NAD(P)/FAD-dependent oxidoreductase [Bacteroidota bacterium]